MRIEISTYGLEEGNIRAKNIRVENANYIFDYRSNDLELEELIMQVPGFHNVENMLAAIAVAHKLGVNEEGLRSAVMAYGGVKRRFEYLIKDDDCVYIDDYAHHPTEIRAFLNSVKALYPNKKITAIFQPHLFTRTRDFADGFAEALDLADEVVLLHIYPARELPIEGISAEMLKNRMKNENVQVCSKNEVLDILEGKNLEVVATIGAGDIDQLVDPIKKYLLTKQNFAA